MSDRANISKHTGHLVEGCGWSTSKPTVPGWYWLRAAKHLGPIIVCLHMDGTDPESVDGWVVDFAGDERHMESNKLHGEWSGPIPLPTDAPAQGFYKAEEVEALLVKRSAKKVMYPIMQGPSVPWEVMAPHESMAQTNHSQSLERLAERGGLSPGEAWCVVNGIRISSGGGRQWDLWSKSWFEYAERINLHYDKADEAEELLGEVYSTLETLVVLVPDIGSLIKVKWLLDRLRKGRG